MKKNWVLFTAFRYIFKSRSNSPVLAILGIATGVLALIVIISVMNGFQMGFIESILEVSSYHLRVESFAEDKLNFITENINASPSVRAVVPFKEFQAIARGKRTGQQAINARGLNEDALFVDLAMAQKLEFEEGSFDIEKKGSILLGAELARRLGAAKGDEITLFSITGIMSQEEEGAGFENFTVTGVFRTGYYEYDSSWAFLNISENAFNLNECKTIIGIKLFNRFNDKIAQEEINKLSFINAPEFKNIKITSWRDYNRSFFGALRTEKLFMFILVGLIFIVVGLNIFQAQRRAVMQRREEIGLLRAVGGGKNAVRLIFVCDGAIIGLSGAGLGLAAGLSVALNIQGFFNAIESIANGIINFINLIIGLFSSEWIGSFSVFSPAVFYLKEIPSRVYPMEVFVIFMFGFISALAAAWFASRKIIKIQPAEVLRYE